MLNGDKVFLKLIEKEDLLKRVEWINDEGNHQKTSFDWPTSVAKTEKWFQNQLLDNSKINFTIFEKKQNRPVGMVGLLNLDRINLKAEFYITIGEKEYRGRGIAKESIELILEYSFNEINLNKIYLTTFESNLAAKNLYKKCNFKYEGTLREEKKHQGILKNIEIYSILKKEWR